MAQGATTSTGGRNPSAQQVINLDLARRGQEAAQNGALNAGTEQAHSFAGDLRHLDLVELEAVIEEDYEILWAYQCHVERTSFTPSLLRDVRRLQQSIEDRFTYYTELGQQPFKYLVWASHHPTIFNLGGDLSLFADLIQSGDRDRLKRYAKACIDICYPNAVNHHLPIITVTLAQGDTLGGGFESALSSDIIIAESSAKFGLPEILFGLFPGMGAFSFLSRKLGSAKAERIIKSGKIYTAEELHEIGLVEVVCEDGMGQEAVREYVTANAHRHNAHQAIYRVRQASNPVSYQEMSAIIDIWVDTAMNLDESDLRRMHRLAAAQERRRLRQSTSREAER